MVQEGGRMRTHLLSISAFALIATPAAAATRNFGVEDFTKVRVDGPYKVELTSGIPPFAKAEGSQAGLDRVTVEIIGNTLVIHPNRSSWGGYPGENVGPVVITLGTHELTAAWVNGSGSIGIDQAKGLTFDISVQGSGAASIERADVDQLRVAVGGTGSVRIAGKAGKTTAILRGMASFDASQLKSKDALLSADGTATVKAAVSGTVKIDGTGPATFELTGAPACTARLSGSATVSGCGSNQ
jgi:hypothetical protein